MPAPANRPTDSRISSQPKRFWGIFTIAILMSLINFFGTALSSSPAPMFPAAMWSLVAFCAFKGNPAPIQSLGFAMAGLQVALGVYIYNQLVSDRQSQIMLSLSPEDFLLGVIFTVSVWLGVAFRASYLKTLSPSSNLSDEAAKKEADPAYMYIPRKKQVEPPQVETSQNIVIPAAVDQSTDTRIASLPTSDDNAPKAAADTEAQTSQADQPSPPASDQRPEVNEVNLGDFPKAQMAIEYRPDVMNAWTKTQALTVPFQRRFMEILESDPRSDPQKLAASLQEEFKKEQRPFDDETANDALEDVRTISPSAVLEFKNVYETFGDTVPLPDLFQRIEAKYGPSARTIALEEQKNLEEQERQRKLEEQKKQEELETQRKLEELERQRKLEELERQRKLEEETQRKLEELERQRKLKGDKHQKLFLTAIGLCTAIGLTLWVSSNLRDANSENRNISNVRKLVIEIRLRSLGYSTGEVDGIFDRETRDGIKQWQEENGFLDNGIITEDQAEYLLSQNPPPLEPQSEQ